MARFVRKPRPTHQQRRSQHGPDASAESESPTEAPEGDRVGAETEVAVVEDVTEMDAEADSEDGDEAFDHRLGRGDVGDPGHAGSRGDPDLVQQRRQLGLVVEIDQNTARYPHRPAGEGVGVDVVGVQDTIGVRHLRPVRFAVQSMPDLCEILVEHTVLNRAQIL